MSETAATKGFGPDDDDRCVVSGDVAGLVHRINNPLFAILGHVEFALRDAEPGSTMEERMRIIQRTGLEIKEILNGLVEASREESNKAA